MKRPFVALSLGAALLATCLTGAYALWVEMQLTPKALEGDNRKFTVSKKPDDRTQGKLLTYTITMEPGAKGRDISPFTTAELAVIDHEHDAWVGVVPVASTRDGKKVTFWFRVSPAMVAGSRFDISEGAYVGKEQIMGGSSYWLWLRDF